MCRALDLPPSCRGVFNQRASNDWPEPSKRKDCSNHGSLCITAMLIGNQLLDNIRECQLDCHGETLDDGADDEHIDGGSLCGYYCRYNAE